MPTDLPPYISAMDVDARIREIAKAGLKGRLLLLLGAGFSKDARGYPLGHQLAATLLLEAWRCSEEDAASVGSRYELAAVAQQFFEKVTDKRQQLLETIRTQLTKPAGTESDAEASLRSIASICRLRRIYTTNFDSVIEEALGPRAKVVSSSIAAIREFEETAALADLTGVFHLNGTLDDPKITESDLRSHRSIFYELLRQDMLTQILVMVGYSFRDDITAKIFTEIFDLLTAVGQGRHNYVVMPVESELEYKTAERLWISRGDIVLIPLPAGSFLNRLSRAIEQSRYEASIEAIHKETGQSIKELNDALDPFKDGMGELTPSEIAETIHRLLELRRK